jgi:hypothetical protein
LLAPALFTNYGLSNSGLRRQFLLKAHLEAVEQHLLAISRIPANAGHMLHRGTPREAFVKEFLIGHLSARLAVGSGEIIDASSLPREQRNQFDIIIYRADYPKIDLGGGINAFLAESVVATIEVKSLLNESELDVAIKSASNAKRATEPNYVVYLWLCATWDIIIRNCLFGARKYIYCL